MHSFPYKVTLDEVLRGKLWDVQRPDVKLNIKMLLFRINYIRSMYGKPMVVTSGLRSLDEQKRINPSAPNSNHTLGAAIDISDPDGELHYWCRTNEDALIDVGLWMEERQEQKDPMKNWLHLQIYPPKSGRRWFDP